MKTYTHNGETHTLKEWCAILQTPAPCDDDLQPFVEELEFDGRLSNAALYELYCIWAEETTMNKPMFEKRVAKALKHHRPDIKPFKNGNVRGWSMGQ